jgi:PAS domain S-box-containing protein
MNERPTELSHGPLLQAILDGLNDGVVALGADGRVLLANPAAVDLLGMPLVGLGLEEWARQVPHWLPDGVSWCPDDHLPMARALAGETVEEVEVFVRPPARPAGLALSLSARPVAGGGAVVVLRNVTARKALRDSQALYHSLVESLPFSVFRKDATGMITYVNRAFCAALGLPPDRVLGRTEFDFMPAPLAARYREEERMVLDSREVLERLEEHLSMDCGRHCRCGPADEMDDTSEPKYIHSRLAPVFDAEGRVVGTQGAFWNATSWKRAERNWQQSAADLRRLNEELARSNDELQQFAYVASHDLQEPLRMVKSFTQLLKARYGEALGVEGREFIDFAVDGATRMQGLIEDLLSYSRVTTRGKPLAETDSETAVEKAIANLHMLIVESGAIIEREPLPLVRADASQLAQLFQNLIGNALKFRRGQPPRVRISARYERGEWLFGVRDNGIGIEERHRERIFQIFQRLHPRERYPGSGIGLAICKKIVERHGGRIWLESEVGVGSTFWFTLPVEWFEAD